ncbi:glycerophosphodiester phosphodiesterase family protein [Bifidobacterium psychraerophilum]|uniref:Glycerophosphoryl diester phosphodiesterase n=1 Tax=Bifidobacterium psychraerophilum TaxID=218140 RepID=A0A087CFB5_9BIFI|nr:glycerophosphodiester phosphodiesterase family protein [Bifidobacterium psychraerophilum]KFI81965.1 glycerophosphoryl diester phosphodiesterase [Bifidobacterium psychraerophilum]PKA94771.1 glycerophosphoryl diester phosphodiesterase [Bifidobacterium psychraerophilum DSM 22366]
MSFGKNVRRLALFGAAAAGLGTWALAPRGPRGRSNALVTATPGGVPGQEIYENGPIPSVYYAHRGLHDSGSGLTAGYLSESVDYVTLAREMAAKAGYGDVNSKGAIAPENSLAAFAAACEAGFGIELDLQLSKDGHVVVVHDDDLARVAGVNRRISDLTYAQLCRIPLFPSPAKAGDSHVEQVTDVIPEAAEDSGYAQYVPLLTEVLDVVDGRVPLIIEYKMGDDFDEELMKRADAILQGYQGPYVIESFNPLAVNWYRLHRPEVCRGQLSAPEQASFKGVADVQHWLAGKLMFNWLGRPDFIAYDWHGGDSLPVTTARSLGAITVSWTVRSSAEQEASDPYFDYMIFESFVPLG